MEARIPKLKGRMGRVKKNLRQGLALAWAASPKLFLRYTFLGIFNAIMPPISVYLGAVLVNKIAAAQAESLEFRDILPIIIGLWATIVVQRSVGSYLGYGRNLY